MEITIIIAAVALLVVGCAVTYLITRKSNEGIVEAAEEKANGLIKEAQAQGELFLKDKTMEVKEKFYQLKTEHEKHIAEKDKTLSIAENRIKQKEGNLNQQMEQNKRSQSEIEAIQNNLTQQMEIMNRRK